ncbi:MAG: class I SAM-dependent methyltransferase [Phycisphaerae bacterium]
MNRPPLSRELADRARREIEHGRRIASQAEAIWNWASPAGQRRARRRAELLIRLGRLGPGVSALEVGCGTGLFTSLVARTGAEITAVDLSPELLARARARPQCRGVRFLLADLHSPGQLGGPYEVVFGCSILHHLHLPTALPHLLGALRPGGRFVFTEPNMLNPHVWLERHVPAIRRAVGATPDETAFYRWQLCRLLERHGLTSVWVKPFDWLHPATPRVLIGPVSALGRALEALPLIRELGGSLLIFACKRP